MLLKTGKNIPVAEPETNIRRFKTPRSIRVLRAPTKTNFDAWKNIKNFFPIIKATQSPSKDKIGKAIGKTKYKIFFSIPKFFKIAKPDKATISPIISGAIMSMRFI